MPVVVVVGGQWGDEGKGRIVDLLAEKADIVARYQGGDNAGHTVVNSNGRFALHLVPAGIFYPWVTCIIGSGVVVNPKSLLEELAHLKGRGVDVDHLLVSDRTHVVMPYHVLLDGLEEEDRGGRSIGTTRKGVGPAYVDKVARVGIRIGDLLDETVFRDKLAAVLLQKNRILTKLYGVEPLSLDSILAQYLGYGQQLARYVADTTPLVQQAISQGKKVLLEGAQGSLLDLDWGTYPYVTSSSPTAGAACAGLGLGPTRIDHSLGVFKAYTTRVGAGPFPTELTDETGRRLRECGQEYGATTGRPRRCGWFDAVVARLSAQFNGFDSIAITRLDILDSFPTLKICTAYRYRDRVYDTVPANIAILQECQPIYEEHPGWQVPTSHVRRFDDLPPPAQNYVRRLAELVGCRLDIVTVGSERSQTIMLHPVL